VEGGAIYGTAFQYLTPFKNVQMAAHTRVCVNKATELGSNAWTVILRRKMAY
jgi:hypothetical protein